MSKGELWNILPYAGLWDTTPGCGVQKDLKTPPFDKTNLAGIPFAGDNSGANPNLRLISFYANHLNGPITSTGPRSTFFKTYLNYKISWKIESFAGCDLEDNADGVQIGFYTAPYTANSPGPDNMLLMLEENGPALYKANSCNKFRGCFKTSELIDMYVVTDANVLVKLKVTSSLPDEVVVPCFTEMFKPYKYLSKCGNVIATQFLVDNETGKTLIEPAKKYINTSKKMIDYLFATSVNIVLFEDPAQVSTNLVNNLGALVGRTVVFIPRTTPKNLTYYDFGNYYLETTGLPLIPGGGYPGDSWGFTLTPIWAEFAFKVQYEINILIPEATGSTPNETRVVRYPGSVEVGRPEGLNAWQGFRGGRQNFNPLPVSGTNVTLSGILSPIEVPSFLGFKVIFDEGSQIANRTIPRPSVQLRYLAVEFFRNTTA